MIFDDSHPHEVWERLRFSAYRVVRRRGAPAAFPLSTLNRAIIWIIARSPSVAEPMDRIRQYASASSKPAEPEIRIAA